MNHFDIIIIGGGAAGFYASLSAKSAKPKSSVLLLEKSAALLSKVRVSGGGRCNVTHACFDPLQLVKNYARGGKELIGPFHRFQPRDTIEWFESRGVKLKTEADGRMFPVTDSSQTIIDCLISEAKKLKVDIRIRQSIETVQKEEGFILTLSDDTILMCSKLIIATGSSPQGHILAKSLGHSIQAPVPSLFTFNVPSSPLKGLEGISVEQATIQIIDSPYNQTGPLLITHWGFSGPAALKLSAWGARFLQEKNYRVSISINWVPSLTKTKVLELLRQIRSSQPSTTLLSSNPCNLPKNLWKRLLELENLDAQKRLSETSNDALNRICNRLTGDMYQVEGKTTYKEEFVTCGGVTLSEVDFKTMQSKICPGLYFAGEVLDIDAVTGGFNFQNAWTTGWIAGQS